MGKTKYYYNPETCQYERKKLTFLSVLSYGSGLIFMAGALFAGLLIVSDQIIESSQERMLESENYALKKYKVILTSQLDEIENKVKELGEKDKAIHLQLFDELPGDKAQRTNREEKQRILQAGTPDFMDFVAALKNTTAALNKKSHLLNGLFGELLSMKPEDAALLHSLPTLFPIEHPSLDLAVSGFGERIHPFHKGKYMHPGIDIAAPRGTTVFSAGPGSVTIVKHSSLQAGYGTYIEIDHGNGFITRYAHLDDTQVKPGEKVAKGQPIGTVGSSGGSIAPHLHYEIVQDDNNVDPVTFMVEGLNSIQYTQLVSLSKKHNQSLD